MATTQRWCGLAQVMTGVAHLSARQGGGAMQLKAGASPYGESGNQAGVPPAHRHVGPTERDGGSGRSGPAREV
jgi:hypothetical protein